MFTVWLTVVLSTAFIQTSVQLIMLLPRMQTFLADKNPNQYEKAQAKAHAVQADIVRALSVFLTVSAFGTTVPALMVLMPVAIWLQLCALDMVARHREGEHWGEKLATQVLVGVPARVMRQAARIGLWCTTTFIMIDLGTSRFSSPQNCLSVGCCTEFDVGPMVLFAVFAALELLFEVSWDATKHSRCRCWQQSKDTNNNMATCSKKACTDEDSTVSFQAGLSTVHMGGTIEFNAKTTLASVIFIDNPMIRVAQDQV